MEISFFTQTDNPVEGVTCVGFTADNDSIGKWVSNEKGIANITDINGEKINYIIASKQGFAQRLIRLDSLPFADARVVLSKETNLNEIIITPKDMEDFTTHISYRLSEKDMARYTNVLQSLNEIPYLTVLPNGGVFYEGNTKVKILVDGVEASIQEVQTLSKEDVAKVNVYRNPPARFLAQGVESVIDIQLKSKIIGGNGALELSQAFQSLIGDNSAAFYYNYRQSRFSVRYYNENKHCRKKRMSEVLDYNFDGVHYNKTKEGLDSKSHLDDNSLNLSYQINKPDNFLYNVKASIAFDRNGGSYNQRVATESDSFLAANYLHSGFTKYTVGNYFEKSLGENSGKLMGNINFQHYSTKYSSAYNEFREEDGDFHDSYSDYKTHLNGVFSEFQYEFPVNHLGYFSLSAYEVYKNSKYVDTSNPFYQTSNSLGALAMWLGRKSRISWYAALGFGWLHTSSTMLTKSHNLWIPSPMINLNWRPLNQLQFTLSYSYQGEAPSIAQLSETEQWIDNRLVYHGNSTLKPYKTHSLGLNLRFNSNYVILSLQNFFKSSPDMICDIYTLGENYMLQSIVNLSKYQELSSMLDMSVRPLGNSKLVLWSRIVLADVKGRNSEYSWNGHRFQWMSTMSLNLDHWTFNLYYQYPGKIAEGQLIRPRSQCWSITAFYRPMTNLSIGVEYFMPFGKGMKESEYTIKDAPVFASTESIVRDYSNLVSINLSYNFSFGKNRNSASPQYENGDNDSGILRK